PTSIGMTAGGDSRYGGVTGSRGTSATFGGHGEGRRMRLYRVSPSGAGSAPVTAAARPSQARLRPRNCRRSMVLTWSGGRRSRLAQQLRHADAQPLDLLVRLAQVGEHAQVVQRDGAAAEQPGADAEQFIEFHQLAVADEDLLLAHQHLDQALEL